MVEVINKRIKITKIYAYINFWAKLHKCFDFQYYIPI